MDKVNFVLAAILQIVFHKYCFFAPWWILVANNWYVPVFVGFLGFGINVFCTTSYDREFNYPMAFSSLPFILPAIMFWILRFYTVSISIAFVVFTSAASDAVTPFNNGDRNFIFYELDVSTVIGNFVCCALIGASYVMHVGHTYTYYFSICYTLWMIAIFVLPILVWLRNKKKNREISGRSWETRAIVWHLVASLSCFSGALSCYFVAD